MQIMVEKGMLDREESNMKHVYTAKLDEKETKSFLLDRFVETMYKGSASSLMMQLLENKKPSREELEKIKELLNKL